MKISLLSIFVLCLSGSGFCTPPAKQLPAVYSMDAAILAANKIKIREKDPVLLPAYQQLLKEAAVALDFQPVSVMEKERFPPSGNKHDYMSIAPYFWPDSSKPGGTPYKNRDGLINPEVKEYKDKIYLAAVCDAVNTLALAYYFSGEERYASHAGKLLRVWFLDTATKMNPNLDFAQAIKGRATGRGYGLIDTRHFVKLVDALGLLQGAKGWTKHHQAGIKQWFADFLHWMHTSKNGIDESNTTNNHAVWYDLQRLALAQFTGENTLAKRIVTSAGERLDKQMDNNGSFPLEMKRTISLHYTVFIMDPLFTIAQLAKHTGVDFWTYQTPSGKSLKKGFDYLVPYLLRQEEWKGSQILPFDYTQAIPLLIEGARHYQCGACLQQVKMLLGENAPTSRYRLTTDQQF